MWVLNCGGYFPCGVFDSKEAAEKAIEKYGLTGTLTQYPINMLVYDWAFENGYLNRNKSEETPEFVGKYTTAYQDHYHYDGQVRGRNR